MQCLPVELGALLLLGPAMLEAEAPGLALGVAVGVALAKKEATEEPEGTN